jgi:hypothetical protein
VPLLVEWHEHRQRTTTQKDTSSNSALASWGRAPLSASDFSLIKWIVAPIVSSL